VVPILPDGSCYFEAPADTPLFLDPIDAGGNRVLMEWNYPNTSVKVGTHYPATQLAYMTGRPGETRSCYGCHATQTDAVPNVSLMALKLGPVKIRRRSTDLEYRRNEPEAYRLRARLDEVAKYRAWLHSDNEVQRARACELLMYIEDGAEPGVPDIARLLTDKSVEVRRSAALALTRLATTKDGPALEKALDDADWQVRFYVASTLEVLGENFGPAPKVGYQNPPRVLTHFVVLFGGFSPKEQLCLWAEMTSRRMAKATPFLGHEGPGKYFLRIGPTVSGLANQPRSFETLSRQAPTVEARALVRKELAKSLPDILAVRAAGKLRDAKAVKYLIPLLANHEQEYHAAEAAVALGRIGTKEAVAALWDALRREVPKKQVHISRYLQHGPRPEEYALLKGLILAKAKLSLSDVYLVIALLPNTFMEKPRYEDRMRDESQRVLMPRMLLERAGLRRRAVEILIEALQGQQAKSDPLYQQLLKGINLERPFSEHGRPFPVVKQIGPEEALWLLNSLIVPVVDLDTGAKRQTLENLVVPRLTSKNQRERVDAAVLLGRTGFGPKAAAALLAEIAKPYSFPEIASIGKGMPDPNERDKAYMVRTLAWHIADVDELRPFADPKKMYRDIRYGLARGLAKRGKADGLSLLVEMYRRDPIMLIRQQARYAIADIQDAYRLAGKDVPQVTLGEQQPLESGEWRVVSGEKGPSSLAPRPSPLATPSGPALVQYVKTCLAASHFRDLNFAQATGARYMMIADVEETRLAFAALARQPGDAARQALLDALDTPYPYAHYLAAQALAERGDKTVAPVLLKKLDPYVKSADTVGFWWCCEALGRLKAKEAVPILTRYAVSNNPPGTFGPPGMATGYAAARALAQIVADPKRSEVARLLASDNIWLRAGALRGLAEAHAPRILDLLRQAAEEGSPALVRQEAQVQLRRLGARDGGKVP
jgi:HEAT repeat protein